jgi:hypothetical protein
MNLDSLGLKDTTLLQLRHPVTEELLWADKEQTQARRHLAVWPSSKQYRNAITAMQNRQLRRGKQKVRLLKPSVKKAVNLLVTCSAAGVNLEYNGAALDNAEPSVSCTPTRSSLG